MGVKNLWRLLLPVGHRVSIETLAHKTLAIDASIWCVSVQLLVLISCDISRDLTVPPPQARPNLEGACVPPPPPRRRRASFVSRVRSVPGPSQACRDPETGRLLPNRPHVRIFLVRLMRLLYHRIKPVVVFDGVSEARGRGSGRCLVVAPLAHASRPRRPRRK